MTISPKILFAKDSELKAISVAFVATAPPILFYKESQFFSEIKSEPVTNNNDSMVREKFIDMVENVEGVLNKSVHAEIVDILFDFAFAMASEIKSDDCGEFL